jgi:hypothetical protein
LADRLWDGEPGADHCRYRKRNEHRFSEFIWLVHADMTWNEQAERRRNEQRSNCIII